jgi:hypothetical protein
VYTPDAPVEVTNGTYIPRNRLSIRRLPGVPSRRPRCGRRGRIPRTRTSV